MSNATIQNVLAKTRAAADQRAAAARTRYQEFVRAAGAGKEVDPQEVAAFLDQHGFTVQQFQADVELHAKRIGWKAEVDAEPGLRKKEAILRAKLDAIDSQLDADLKAIKEKALAAATPLQAELAQTERLIRSAEQAVANLAGTVPEDLRARIEEARARRAAAREAAKRPEKTLADTRTALNIVKSRMAVPHYANLQDGKDIKEVQRLTAILPMLEQEYADAMARVAEIDKEIDQISAAANTP